MKTTFIRLPNFHLHNEKQQPPLGILYLAAYLREHDYLASVVDLAGIPEGQWRNLVPADSEVYGITATSADYGMAKRMLYFLRLWVDPSAKVIIGGAHATVAPEQCVRDGFDAAVMGEGELTALEFVQGAPLNSIRGLAFLCDGKAVINERRPLLRDIDSIPFPARDLLARENIIATDLVTDSSPATVISTARGCPFRCSFCVQKIWMNCWRHRSSESIRAELQLIQEQYPEIREIRFIDDMVGFHSDHSQAICKAFQGTGLHWRCHLRVGIITEFLLMSFREAGCIEVSVGIESGDERVLRHNRKGCDLAAAASMFRTAKDLGLRTRAYFIVGLPGETPESVENTKQYVASLAADAVNIFAFVPYPGCDVWEHPEKYDYELLNSNLDDFWMIGDKHCFVGRTTAMDVDDLERAYQETWKVVRETGKARWMNSWGNKG